MYNPIWHYSGVWMNKASQQEKTAADASTNLSNTISKNMNTTFANSQATQGALNAQLQRQIQMGQAGQGFEPGEEANLRSSADENSAHAAVNAQRQLQQATAGRSAGGAATSGSVGANDALLASTAAQGNANAQRAITGQNSLLARQNLQSGLAGEEGLAGQEIGQSDSLTGSGVGAAGQSFNEETQAYQPSNFWSNLGGAVLSTGLNAIAPGVGTLAGGVFKGLTGGGGESDGEGGSGMAQAG